MRIALAQINPTVGDIAGNARRSEEFISRAAFSGARGSKGLSVLRAARRCGNALLFCSFLPPLLQSLFFYLAISVAGVVSAQTASSQTSMPVPRDSQWDLEALLAALQWREERLQNCSIETEENLWLTPVGAPESLLRTDKLIIRRKGDAMWISHQSTVDSHPTLNIDSQIQTWDKSVCRSLQQHKLRSGQVEMDAKITGKKPPVLDGTIFCFTVLGVEANEQDFVWSQWIRNFSSQSQTSATVDEEIDNGHPLVRLTMLMPQRHQDYYITFCPDKDFVLNEFILKMHIKERDGSNLEATNEIQVSESKQVDGLVLPTKASYRIGQGMPSGGNRGSCDFTALSLKTPTDEQMRVDFPAGAVVMDSLNHDAYQINPDGTHTKIEYYDNVAGRKILPPTRPTTSE